MEDVLRGNLHSELLVYRRTSVATRSNADCRIPHACACDLVRVTVATIYCPTLYTTSISEALNWYLFSLYVSPTLHDVYAFNINSLFSLQDIKFQVETLSVYICSGVRDFMGLEYLSLAIHGKQESG